MRTTRETATEGLESAANENRTRSLGLGKGASDSVSQPLPSQQRIMKRTSAIKNSEQLAIHHRRQHRDRGEGDDVHHDVGERFLEDRDNQMELTYERSRLRGGVAGSLKRVTILACGQPKG